MLVERGLLREVGSFRSVRRFVDAQLIAAIQRAGAATYRTHGLGYLLAAQRHRPHLAGRR